MSVISEPVHFQLVSDGRLSAGQFSTSLTFHCFWTVKHVDR